MILTTVDQLLPKDHRAILLFSGGFDSTLVGLLLKLKGIPTVGLSIDYPSRPNSERQYSTQLARELGFIQYQILDVPLHDNRNLLPEVRERKYEAWFPHRNMIFFGIAAYCAVIYDCNLIATGIKLSDSVDFDDSNPSFFQLLDQTVQVSGRPSFSHRINLFTPLIAHEEIAEMLMLQNKEIEDILYKTWSCWRDGPMPCGECVPCKARERFYYKIGQLKAKEK